MHQNHNFHYNEEYMRVKRDFSMLSSLQAHSIEIWILLASVMLSCRQASNKLQVIQVSEAKYHLESNYEGNS